MNHYDYSEIDRKIKFDGSFSVLEAAYLWCENDPIVSRIRFTQCENYVKVFERLRKAILKNEIETNFKEVVSNYCLKKHLNRKDEQEKCLTNFIESIDDKIIDYWYKKIIFTTTALRKYAEQIGEKPLFLFPEEREKKKTTMEEKTKTACEITFERLKEGREEYFYPEHEYRTVIFHRELSSGFYKCVINLTSQQALVVQILHEAYENRIPDVPLVNISDRIGTAITRLRDTFKLVPEVWNLLITSKKKGTYRLNLPQKD